MIALFLLVQAAMAAVPGLGTLPRQQLPTQGCAAYLWTVGDGRLAAMATADPAQLRVALDGKAPIDLPRVSQHGEGGLGFAGSTDYRGAGPGSAPGSGIAATLAMRIVTRADLRDGGAVPEATLTVERPGQDTLVVPLGGLIGCRP